MFKKRTKESKIADRVEPRIDSNSSIRQPKGEPSSSVDGKEVTSKSRQSKKKVKVKKKSNWFNWFVPLLLTAIGIGFLIFYPAPDKQQVVQPKTKEIDTVTSVEPVFNAQSLSLELVTRYFNGTDEDRDEQKIALEKTLEVLNTSNDPQATKALSELQSSNINAAKKSLITYASTQTDLQESSQTWINIGNVQNLSSSRQALQAFKKAGEMDPENVNAYLRQGHVYRQQKQLDLAEKAYKRAQSFANQSTANQALTLANFGVLNVSKGKLVEAEDAFNESLSIYKKIEDDVGIANISFNLANLYRDSERFAQAETSYKVALKNFTELNEFKKMADTHAALGGLFQQMELTADAEKQYEIALELNTNNNFDESKPAIYQSLGEIAQELGDDERAQGYFAKAQGIDPNNAQDNSIADELGRLAIASRKQQNFLKAEEQHKQAIKIYQNNKSIAGTISQQINLGFLYKVWGKIDLACLVWRDTLTISQRANSNRASRVQQLVDSSCS